MALEERVTRIEEQMLVQSELTVRFERRVEQFMERTEQFIENMGRWIESAERRMARLEVLSTAVLERIERFIQGQERNGHA
ncbi:MAG TPA: hypothetical protein VI455_17335 [Terriglobia bacterium]